MDLFEGSPRGLGYVGPDESSALRRRGVCEIHLERRCAESGVQESAPFRFHRGDVLEEEEDLEVRELLAELGGDDRESCCQARAPSEESEACAFLCPREVLTGKTCSKQEARVCVVRERGLDEAQEILAVVGDEGIHCGEFLGGRECAASSFPERGVGFAVEDCDLVVRHVEQAKRL